MSFRGPFWIFLVGCLWQIFRVFRRPLTQGHFKARAKYRRRRKIARKCNDKCHGNMDSDFEVIANDFGGEDATSRVHNLWRMDDAGVSVSKCCAWVYAGWRKTIRSHLQALAHTHQNSMLWVNYWFLEMIIAVRLFISWKFNMFLSCPTRTLCQSECATLCDRSRMTALLPLIHDISWHMFRKYLRLLKRIFTFVTYH